MYRPRPVSNQLEPIGNFKKRAVVQNSGGRGDLISVGAFDRYPAWDRACMHQSKSILHNWQGSKVILVVTVTLGQTYSLPL